MQTKGDKKNLKPNKTNSDLVKRKKLAKKTEEFKKAYRQFYDDVKISDREDW